MTTDNFQTRFRGVQHLVSLEIEAIEAGKRYGSATEIESFIDQIWEEVKDSRSDVVFEFTDHFRTVCRAGLRDGLDETACKLFAFIHQRLAKRMVESEAHRDYLFCRYASQLPG